MALSRSEWRRAADRARFLAHLLSIRALRRPRFPLYANLVINSRCTLRCTYCFGSYFNRQHPDMTLSRFRELVDLLHQRGTRYIMLQGGEPFLHPDLGAMISHLHQRGILVSLTSNGQLPERLPAVPELELLDNLCFSLDGAPAGNDLVRGAGAYARVAASIATMHNHFSIPVRINTTIHKHVLDDAPHLARFVTDNRVEWGLSFLFRGTETLRGNSLEPAPERLRSYLDTVLAYKRQGVPIFTSTRVLRYARDWPETAPCALNAADSERLLGRAAITCQYGHYEIIVDEDERLYPCNGLQGVFTPRSIAADGFDAAFARLQEKPCTTCRLPPLMNTSAMINWDWAVIAETVCDSLRRRRRNFLPSAR